MGQTTVQRTAHRNFLLLLATTGAIAFCGAIQAQEFSAAASPQVWLNPGIFSRHFDRDKDLRENNTGIGAEVVLSDDHVLAAGNFINSNRRRSRYGAYEWRPLHWEVGGFKIHGGVAAGGFDGYPNYRNGAWFPAALPMLTIEAERFGMNLFVVPTIAHRLDGAIAVQFKLRTW
jgi:hypothetical protein